MASSSWLSLTFCSGDLERVSHPCACVLHAKSLHLYQTPCDPTDCNPPDSWSQESQARIYWVGVCTPPALISVGYTILWEHRKEGKVLITMGSGRSSGRRFKCL